jgi:hypothetical protein
MWACLLHACLFGGWLSAQKEAGVAACTCYSNPSGPCSCKQEAAWVFAFSVVRVGVASSLIAQRCFFSNCILFRATVGPLLATAALKSNARLLWRPLFRGVAHIVCLCVCGRCVVCCVGVPGRRSYYATSMVAKQGSAQSSHLAAANRVCYFLVWCVRACNAQSGLLQSTPS